jgi:serine/threonine-protein kinase
MPAALEQVKVALADRYAVERVLGSGGMATVFLAQDLKHRRQVAIKVLHPELAAALGSDRFLVCSTTLCRSSRANRSARASRERARSPSTR